ncbi:MAG: hypothetical protein A3J24_02385 [Deltaproteobacteria bacterium RIFCSPLOWO2_02_FULL_53_8]|nr:MAG: hypothetical protein A3J24_02385 [Deltaproteobacteria bacterium RIFCSPLOWO2_02_FULL_53_8]
MSKQVAKRDGSQGVIGSLELEILEALWLRAGASGKEVFEAIKRRRAIALTTVLTVLERLTKKGFVRRAMGESVYLYYPSRSRDEFAALVSHDVLKGIMEISASGACASFVDTLANVDPAELDRLSLLIDKKRKEMKSGKNTL